MNAEEYECRSKGDRLMGTLGLPEFVALPLEMAFLMIPLMIPPYWMIFKKAGFSKWLSLLMLIPFINFIILYIVAFSRWRIDAATVSKGVVFTKCNATEVKSTLRRREEKGS
jgi:hypothetical protein